MASVVDWTELWRRFLALVHKGMGAAIVAVITAVVWAIWARLDGVPRSLLGLGVLATVPVALASLYYIRRLWPKPKMSPMEERSDAIRKKLLAVRSLATLASDFGGYAARPLSRSVG